eukprot:355978-Chlamydomonas_euryale.AAC.1
MEAFPRAPPGAGIVATESKAANGTATRGGGGGGSSPGAVGVGAVFGDGTGKSGAVLSTTELLTMAMRGMRKHGGGTGGRGHSARARGEAEAAEAAAAAAGMHRRRGDTPPLSPLLTPLMTLQPAQRQQQWKGQWQQAAPLSPLGNEARLSGVGPRMAGAVAKPQQPDAMPMQQFADTQMQTQQTHQQTQQQQTQQIQQQQQQQQQQIEFEQQQAQAAVRPRHLPPPRPLVEEFLERLAPLACPQVWKCGSVQTHDV